ncbi:MAG: hypothetical protein HYU66_25945 [Armatimonadetes bacterium]|nr:hypothetical protein [Armatimonadota bacterium]
MTFDEVVGGISTVTDLRRIASAHVVDFRNLDEERLREALRAVKPQYLHDRTVQDAVTGGIWLSPDHECRVVAPLLLCEVLLQSADYDVLAREAEEQTIALEQQVLNESNELDLAQIAGARQGDRHQFYQLYQFVLAVVWETEGTASVEEVSLLRRLRERLGICEYDSQLLDAQLGVYPKKGNETHTRDEISRVRRSLQARGLLFVYRDKSGDDHDVVPEELAGILRQTFGMDLRRFGYQQMLADKRVRGRQYLEAALQRRSLPWLREDTVEKLQQRIMRYLPAAEVLGGLSPRDGLSSEELQQWLGDLGLPTSGSKVDRTQRLLAHYDGLRPVRDVATDPRVRLFELYEALAGRDRETLRAQHLIEKDLDIERKFEEATVYLFETLLNHSPLNQVGSNHPDGLLSFRGMYVMWDNKSKDAPGMVNLKDHLPQFNTYMDAADKAVPMFLVVGPGFTVDSEGEAIRYTATHFGRNIVLITAAELKALACEWSSPNNPGREEPFPLGLLARSGRFSRAAIGTLRA